MKTAINLDENTLREAIRNAVNEVLNEGFNDNVEDIPMYDVLTSELPESDIPALLDEMLYDENDRPVGRLRDMHIKY